jgi:hypothetical protein
VGEETLRKKLRTWPYGIRLVDVDHRLALDAANRKLSSSKKDSKALENEVDIATQR